MSTPAINSFTPQDADRLLGLADQFLEDWEQNEGKDDPECVERRTEWNAIRPLLAAAPTLLSACLWMMRELCESWNEDLDTAIPAEYRAAIALAVRGANQAAAPSAITAMAARSQ